MRDYKFGGFHEEENGKEIIYVNNKKYIGEWVYGYYFKIDNFDKKDKVYIIPNYASALYYYEVIPETVRTIYWLKR